VNSPRKPRPWFRDPYDVAGVALVAGTLAFSAAMAGVSLFFSRTHGKETTTLFVAVLVAAVLLQTAYLVPCMRFAVRAGRRDVARGLAVGTVLSLLICGTCWMAVV
jgi:hypothetical protein